MRAKRVPVLPTDKEKDESEVVHMTIRSQCETEDSHKCSPKESLVLQVTMDRGPFAHGVHMDPVLTQKTHGAVETCQVLHESSETRAVNGVLQNLVTSGLGEVLLKRDVRSAIRILANPAWVGRGEKTMAEKSSKYLRQPNSTSENAVKGIETSVTASDCELPEWFGCQFDSESIAPSRIVGCAVHVLNQSEKRGDDHKVRVRLRTRRSRAELMLKSETVNPEHGERGNMDPGKATETSLDRTNGDGERLPQRRTARKQRQPNAFTNFTGVPKNPRELGREQYIGKSLTQRYGEMLGSPECCEPNATPDNVPRKIRAADQSKRD